MWHSFLVPWQLKKKERPKARQKPKAKKKMKIVTKAMTKQ